MDTELGIWEVFVQQKSGEPHMHVGNVHASDPEMALQNARDVFSRRGNVVSIWVAPSNSFTASSPSDKSSFFDPGDSKIYRHPQFYNVPKGVKNV